MTTLTRKTAREQIDIPEITAPTGNVVLDSESSTQQIFDPTTNIDVTLPSINLVFDITNMSANIITVKASDASIIGTIDGTEGPGKLNFYPLVDPPVTNTDWDITATLASVGPGLVPQYREEAKVSNGEITGTFYIIAIGSLINITFPTVTWTSDDNAQTSDFFVPSYARPTAEIQNIYQNGGGATYRVTVSSTGQISIRPFNSANTPTATTSSGGAGSITYYKY